MTAKKKRSPIKERPLRQAGQSINDQINRINDDVLVPSFLFVVGFLALALFDWWQYLANSIINPFAISIVTILVIDFSAFRIRRALRDIKKLKMARDGEMAVGELLDDLRQRGYVIFHDILGQGFNLDHVTLSPQGIFIIETKTWSKPSSGSPKIEYDGEKIYIEGKRYGYGVIDQANSQASWLQKILQESTGKKFMVKTVVVFPGWYVESKVSTSGRRVWVLNPKMLPMYIENEPVRLPREDLHLAAFHLARYVRSSNR